MISIKVPATTANLGPGFDCLGLALNIYNTIEIYDNVDKLTIDNCGIGDNLERNEDNLIYKSIKRLYDDVHEIVPPIRIAQKIDIPVSRGLGSSAACIVGGLIAGNEMLGKPIRQDKILELANEMEGHPDNVAPALLGGLVVSAKVGDGVKYVRYPISNSVKLMALIPDFILSTKMARGVLPSQINYKDAVFNVGRSSLLTASLITGKLENLRWAVEDKLHQPYRLGLIKDGDKIFDAAYEFGSDAIFISGSGSTLMAVISNPDTPVRMHEFLNELSAKWDIRLINVDNEGVTVL